ncbi:MAG: heavy metal translocating P-type ATPase, partial [Bdellovibrionales bacterium]|nr:heavy metal translocating P-type ATPase [Bdellovibrionales bacterium]
DKKVLSFCCRGCQFVYEVIHENGLQGFYRMREATGDVCQLPGQAPGKSYEHYDREEFYQRYVTRISEKRSSILLRILGMHCAACVWLLEKLPDILPGVLACEADFLRGQLRVDFDPLTVAISTIVAQVDALGYQVQMAQNESERKAERRSTSSRLMRLGIAGLAAGNTMLFAVSLYQGRYTGIDPQYRDYFHYLSLLISLPSVMYAAIPFYRSSWQGLKHGMLHIDLPISIGILAGFGLSAWNTFTGRDEVYFDSVCALIFFLLAGRFILESGLLAVQRRTNLLSEFIPRFANRVEGESVHSVLSEEIKVGDTLVIKAGELVSCDGIVVDGSAFFDCSFLTGESRPVFSEVGTSVYAGTWCVEGECRANVLEPSSKSKLAQLVAGVQSAALRRVPLIQLTDRLSRYFVVTVLAVAAITFLSWLDAGTVRAAEVALSFLVVTCPCALGLAAPVTLSVAISRAARRGILITSPWAIERAAQIHTFFFDKTGTLTLPTPTVSRLWILEGDKVVTELDEQILKERWLSVLKVAVGHSSHPLSQAIHHLLARRVSSHSLFPKVTNELGRGLIIEDVELGELRFGSLRWIEQCAIRVASPLRLVLQQLQHEQISLSGVVVNSELRAIFGFSDSLKPGARTLIETLQKQGATVSILSGDRTPVVQRVALDLGVPADAAWGELLPEEKAERVSTSPHSAVIGDGINDTLAFQEAHLSIGVHGGLEAAISGSADVFVRSGSPEDIYAAIDGARQSYRAVRRALVLSLLYNVVGGTLAV